MVRKPKIYGPLNVDQVREALFSAQTSGQALRQLYEAWKAVDSKYSLSFFVKQSGLPSKGYFSEVINGKRKLPLKHATGVSKAFKLRGDNAKYFKLLVAIDSEKSTAKHQLLLNRLRILKKTMSVVRQPMSESKQGLFRALDVFCAFGLFDNAPTREQLSEFFANLTEADLSEALALLLSMGLVEVDNDGYKLIASHFLMGEDEGGMSHVGFLKMALKDAATNVERWFHRRETSYFSSTVVSVKSSEYVEALRHFKKDFVGLQAELESGSADTLVRFNVQIYPVGREEETS